MGKKNLFLTSHFGSPLSTLYGWLQLSYRYTILCIFRFPSEKSWCQVMTEPVSVRGLSVTLACWLFGHCRQAFYQSKADIGKEAEHERKLLTAVREICEEDSRIGGYKLWLILISLFDLQREHQIQEVHSKRI